MLGRLLAFIQNIREAPKSALSKITCAETANNKPLWGFVIILSLQKRGLENSLFDTKHWHDIELQNLGSVITKLEAEVGEIRAETEQQQRDRETLLSLKTQLEKDIAAYHCLLDKEEHR